MSEPESFQLEGACKACVVDPTNGEIRHNYRPDPPYVRIDELKNHHILIAEFMSDIASKDAQIARLKTVLRNVMDTEGCGCCAATVYGDEKPTPRNDHGTAIAEAVALLNEAEP